MSQPAEAILDINDHPESQDTATPPILSVVPDPEVPNRVLFHRAIHHPFPEAEQPEVTSIDLRDFNQAHPEDITNQALSTMLLRLAGDTTSYRDYHEAKEADKVRSTLQERVVGYQSKSLRIPASLSSKLPSAVETAEQAIEKAEPYANMSVIVGGYERSFHSRYILDSGKPDVDKLEELYPEGLTDESPALEHAGLDWLKKYGNRIRQGGNTPERVFRHMLVNTEPEDRVSA